MCHPIATNCIVCRVAKRAPAGFRLLYTLRNGLPIAKDEGMVDAGLVNLVPEKLKWLNVRGDRKDGSFFFVQKYVGVYCFLQAFM